jgi:hypothetical protein
LPFRQVLKLILNDVAKKVFKNPKMAYKHQKQYLCNNIFVRLLTFDKFLKHFDELKSYLKYFPKYGEVELTGFNESEKIDIITHASPLHWYHLMTKHGKSVEEFKKMTDLKEYIHKINMHLKFMRSSKRQAC